MVVSTLESLNTWHLLEVNLEYNWSDSEFLKKVLRNTLDNNKSAEQSAGGLDMLSGANLLAFKYGGNHISVS